MVDILNYMSSKEFDQQLEDFLNQFAGEITEDDHDFIVENSYSLGLVYRDVKKAGGYLRVKSQSLTKELKKYDKSLWNIYEKYFLSFEAFVEGRSKVFLNGALVQKARRLAMGSFQDISQEQVTVIQISTEALHKLNQSRFTLDAIRKNHGHQKIDIRVQRSADTFKVGKKSNRKWENTMTISEYLDYQADPQAFMKKLVKLENLFNVEDILFAVNVDMDSWEEENNTLKQFLPQIAFGSKDDGLSYLRQSLLGVSVPQMYLKVANVYTGGHQENLAVNAVNINHGPGSSIWISIDYCYVEKLRRIVKEEFGIDILTDEGLWLKDPEYFISKGIPIKYTVQNAGDIIVLGAGCLHQVISEGISAHTAWNFMQKNINMFKTMIERYEINKVVNYRTVIPIKTLFFDLFNHERQTLPEEEAQFLLQQLKRFHQEENKIVNQILENQNQINSITLQQDSMEILTCSDCWHEIFIYFVMIFGDEGYQFYCVNCVRKLKFHNPQFVTKYKKSILRRFFDESTKDHLSTICFKNYMGLTTCRQKIEGTDSKQQMEEEAKQKIYNIVIPLDDTPSSELKQLKKMHPLVKPITKPKKPTIRKSKKYFDYIIEYSATKN